MKHCELSKKVWELKNSKIGCNLKWRIRKQAKSYQSGNHFCGLCLEEIRQIFLYNEPKHLLNSHNELFKTCWHKAKFKLNFLKK